MSKNYTNLFKAIGKTDEEIEKRINDNFNEIFFGEEKIYFTDEDMGYVVDTGNNDVRTEGMSYAMMVFVQMNRKQDFDRIWRWTRTYMYMESGDNKGYFAWSVDPSGKKNSYGPAPDGEEFFAMALFFASNRWGDGEGIFNYSAEARAILHDCIHKGEDGIGEPMWNPENKLIKFITNVEFSDPSYHLPHFYELFALWANEEDRAFWKEAVKNSREYLKKACHSETGLAAEYAEYDGTPKKFNGDHDRFYSDSYRVAANIGLDFEWFGADNWECECANKIQRFFEQNLEKLDYKVYEIDGTVIDEPALHPIGLLATTAGASLAADGELKLAYVKKLWDTPPRKGERRYYDNFLYFFAMLALSGNYRIY